MGHNKRFKLITPIKLFFCGITIVAIITLYGAGIISPMMVVSVNAATVGSSVPTGQIMVYRMDRTLPFPGSSGSTTSHAPNATNIPVDLTFSYIDTVQRHITLDVSVPVGYQFVFGMENTSTSVHQTISAAQANTARSIIGSGSFTTQLEFRNLSVANFNRMTTATNGRYHIFVVQIGTPRTINFDTQGGNALAPATITTLHPIALPTPTHPLGLPFIRWLPQVGTSTLTSAQLIEGATLRAMWLDIPTPEIVGGRDNAEWSYRYHIRWSWIDASTTTQIFLYRPGLDNIHIGSTSSTAWDISSHLIPENFPEWGPGEHQFIIRSSIGGVFTPFSNPISFTETRTFLPTPQNIHIVNDEVLIWNTTETTSTSITHIITCYDTGNWLAQTNETQIRLEELYANAWWLDEGEYIENIKIETRCDNFRYFRSVSEVIEMSELDRVELPRLATPTLTFDASFAHSLLFPAISNAVGYDIYHYYEHSGWQFWDHLRYHTVGARRVLRCDGMDQPIELINGYYHWVFTYYIEWGSTPNDNFKWGIRAVGDYREFGSSQKYISEEFNPLEVITINIENIRIDNRGNFTWDGRDHHFWMAEQITGDPIRVSVNGGTETHFWEPFSPHDIGLTLGNAYTIKITVPGTHNLLLTGYAEFEFEYVTQLSTPYIAIEDGRLFWSVVSNAIGYRIYANGVYLATVTGFSFDLTQTNLEVGSHTITIVAIAEEDSVFIDSETSGEVSFVVEVSTNNEVQLATPLIAIENGRLSWSIVPNAIEYRIYANGVYLATVTGFSFDLTQTNLVVGNHTISVIAIAGDGYSDSYTSEEVTFVIETPTDNVSDENRPLFGAIHIGLMAGLFLVGSALGAVSIFLVLRRTNRRAI